MRVAAGLLGRIEIKGGREGIGTEHVVDVVAGVLAWRYDGIETFADEGRPMIEDEIGAMEIEGDCLAHDCQDAPEGLWLD